MSGRKIIDGLKDAVAGNFSRVTIDGQVWQRVDSRSEDISPDYVLPCDVKLPPATTITKGCTLSALMAAFKVRENGWPEVPAEQVAAVNELLKREFGSGDWQTVETECNPPAECYDVRLEARPAEGGEWVEIYPAQLNWVVKQGHEVRATETLRAPAEQPTIDAISDMQYASEDSLPHADLSACTVSCSGQEITIQCNGHDVKDRLMNWLTSCQPTADGEDLGEIAHWIASPMKDVGTFEQFHEVVARAEQVLGNPLAHFGVVPSANENPQATCFWPRCDCCMSTADRSSHPDEE